MDKLSLLISLITKDNDYQLEQAASAQAAALKLGVKIQIVYADNDAVQQTQQILEFIQNPIKRPDAILVEPVGTAMPQVAKAAVAEGIGWSLINADADYLPQLRQQARVPVFSVVSDNEQIGRIQGQQIGAILGDEGTVLYVEGPATRDVARQRTKGMLSSKPPAVMIKTLKGDWTQQSGFHAIQSWLALSTSRDMKVGMIACQNDDMAAGARRAFEALQDLKDRDFWLQLPIIGCDGVSKTGQAWVRQRILTATVVSPPLMGDAIKLLVNSKSGGGQPPERTVVAPTSFPVIADLKKSRGMSAG